MYDESAAFVRTWNAQQGGRSQQQGQQQQHSVSLNHFSDWTREEYAALVTPQRCAAPPGLGRLGGCGCSDDVQIARGGAAVLPAPMLVLAPCLPACPPTLSSRNGSKSWCMLGPQLYWQNRAAAPKSTAPVSHPQPQPDVLPACLLAGAPPACWLQSSHTW